MQFTRHADGTVTADHFDDEVLITVELLKSADPRYLRVDWFHVEILGVPYLVESIDLRAGYATLRRDRETPVAPNVIRKALGFPPCPDHLS